MENSLSCEMVLRSLDIPFVGMILPYEKERKFPFHIDLLKSNLNLDSVLSEISNYKSIVPWVEGDRFGYDEIQAAPRLSGIAGIRKGMKAGENPLSTIVIMSKSGGSFKVLAKFSNGYYKFIEKDRRDTEDPFFEEIKSKHLIATMTTFETTIADCKENTDHSWYVHKNVAFIEKGEEDLVVMIDGYDFYETNEEFRSKLVPEHDQILKFMFS
jgi:hypothetical protein